MPERAGGTSTPNFSLLPSPHPNEGLTAFTIYYAPEIFLFMGDARLPLYSCQYGIF